MKRILLATGLGFLCLAGASAQIELRQDDGGTDGASRGSINRGIDGWTVQRADIWGIQTLSRFRWVIQDQDCSTREITAARIFREATPGVSRTKRTCSQVRARSSTPAEVVHAPGFTPPRSSRPLYRSRRAVGGVLQYPVVGAGSLPRGVIAPPWPMASKSWERTSEAKGGKSYVEEKTIIAWSSAPPPESWEAI